MDYSKYKHYYREYRPQADISIDEFIKELKEGFDEIVKEAKENPLYKDCEFDAEIYASSDESAIIADVYRTETPDELKKRLESEAIKQREKDLKEARVTLLKEDPEYQNFLKLKEKFKDVGN